MDIRFGIVVLVHGPRTLQRYAVFLLKNIKGVHHKVVEVVGRSQHPGRDVIVVLARVCLIDLLAVPCDAAKFKVHLVHKVKILLSRQLVTGWRHVDESSDKARFCIGYLDCLVGTKEKEAVEPRGILTFELLIDQHRLVGDQRVQPGVVLDAGKVTVVLDRNKWIRLKRLQRECIGG